MDRIEALNNYYSTHCDEDARFSMKHNLVEFLTTVRYVEKYLKGGDRILEIGAASGRYSHYFARRGYEVDAIELVPHNIEVFKRNTEQGERITIRQGDALDLAGVPSDAYDVTLLFGPRYHVFNDGDAHRAMSEALRVTKPGGILFAAYISNDSVVCDFGFRRGGFSDSRYRELTDPDTFKLNSNPDEIMAMRRREEIDELMKNYPVERLHFVGVDMLTYLMRETVDSMSDETFDMYMKYIFAVCEREDCVGLSNHLLDIMKKIE